MATDSFKGRPPSALLPFTSAAAVTPNDGADLGFTSRALIVGGAGNVSVDTFDGQTAVVINIAAGIPLNIRATRVRATGTTATGIVALW